MNDRGQGRKPLSPTGELMQPRQIRMTDAEWEQCRELGGAAWVRAQIKRAYSKLSKSDSKNIKGLQP
jgi:hypothetical protein